MIGWKAVARGAAVSVVALASLQAQALYKVVGPDGKVTYTDRPPPGGAANVTPLSAGGGTRPEVVLPLELRQVVSRYPVTLYTMAQCVPCDQARSFLRERGVPFSERVVINFEDSQALLRQLGTRDLPLATVGAQLLRGYEPQNWASYLDAAGYPTESRLPANYQPAAPTPVVPRRPAPVEPSPAEPAAPEAPPASPDGIRF